MERIIIRDTNGNPVRSSRNLRGIVTHANNRLVKVISIDATNLDPVRFPTFTGGGRLCILWEDGTSVETDFQSFDICCGWVSRRSWFEGAPLRINGEDCGKVGRKNVKLMECANGY